jgi:hypothetical protein
MAQNEADEYLRGPHYHDQRVNADDIQPRLFAWSKAHGERKEEAELYLK